MTPIHGHFLIMGGFIYVDEEGESVLDFTRFRRLLGLPFRDMQLETAQARQISFPMITAAEI